MQSIHPFLWPSSSPSRWADYDVVGVVVVVVVVVGRSPSPFSNVQCPVSVVLEAQCPLHKQLEGGQFYNYNYHFYHDEQAVVIRRQLLGNRAEDVTSSFQPSNSCHSRHSCHLATAISIYALRPCSPWHIGRPRNSVRWHTGPRRISRLAFPKLPSSRVSIMLPLLPCCFAAFASLPLATASIARPPDTKNKSIDNFHS